MCRLGGCITILECQTFQRTVTKALPNTRIPQRPPFASFVGRGLNDYLRKPSLCTTVL
jgi:hypothetical protein